MDSKNTLEPFSLNTHVLQDILEHAKPLGHHEDRKNLNIGFGFLYYGLVRVLRPKHVLVIGSGFGFSVVCFALGLKDNESGFLTFIDPSFSILKDGPLKTIGGTNQWADPDRARAHFAQFGVEEIVTHYKLTSEEFFSRWDEFQRPKIDLAFIDGNHAYEHVRGDFLNLLQHSRKNTYILLHDTNIYVRELVRHAGVRRWMKSFRQQKDAFELVDFPYSSGVAIVRVLEPKVSTTVA